MNNTENKNNSDKFEREHTPAQEEDAQLQAEDGSAVIAGRNAVLEALRSDQSIDTLYVLATEGQGQGQSQGSIGKIKAIAREKKIVTKTVTVQKLDDLISVDGKRPNISHQGVVAVLSCVSYSTLEDLLEASKEKGKPPFIIIANEIEDPHNLGAIIRTAEACGADGLIIPKRRSASLNATVYKTSAGAASVLPVARVPNLVAAMKELKRHNIWIYGADMDGSLWCETDLTGGIAIVIGSEENGLNRLVREECDFVVSLPMFGKINSLNASVAAGVIMYEAARQRLKQ